MKRTRKRGKGPQHRAVAEKFVGNILSKYKPKAKRKHRGPKKANHALGPVVGDVVEVQDFFLSLSSTFNQVSNKYYGGDHGPKWFLARLTGGADAAAAAPHYQIQLLNAAGEDAGQGIQYVLRIKFPPGDGGRTYTGGQSGGSSRNRRTRKGGAGWVDNLKKMFGYGPKTTLTKEDEKELQRMTKERARSGVDMRGQYVAERLRTRTPTKRPNWGKNGGRRRKRRKSRRKRRKSRRRRRNKR